MRGGLIGLFALLLAVPGAVAADGFAGQVTVTASVMAQRQEATLPVVEPSSVTVTVANSSGSSLQVTGVTLELGIDGDSVDSQYRVTAPGLPVTVADSESVSLLFRVTPLSGSRVFVPVDLTATASTAQGSATTATRWRVVPQASVTLGQFDAFSLESHRRGLYSPESVCATGGRLFVADTSNNRVLIWNALPVTAHQPPDVVLGQPNLATLTGNTGGRGAGTLYYPYGVSSDGTRLFVADAGNSRVLIWNSIPSSNQTPADLVLGQPDFTSGTANNGGLGAGTLYYPCGVSSDGTRLFVADFSNDRVLLFDHRSAAAPLAVALSYSQSPLAVGAGSLTVTATFTAETTNVPRISIDRPGTGNDVSDAAMTGTTPATVWTYEYTVAPTNGGTILDGPATVTVTGGFDRHGNENQPATNNSFTIDATPPTVALTYSKSATAVGAGDLTLTATFSEALATTPTLAIEGQQTANDQAATAMTATAVSTVWTFTKSIATGGDGVATVTVAGGRDAAGNENVAATNNTFTIDTTAPTVALTYNRQARVYRAEVFLVTATFSEPILPTGPTLTVNGTLGGGSVAAVAMTQGADSTVWTYQTTVQEGDTQGTLTLTLTATDAAGNGLVGQPVNNTFVVATAGLAASLEYSKPDRLYRAGVFAVTATFSELITPTAPAVTVSGTTAGRTVSGEAMTQGVDRKEWTWQTTLQEGDTQGPHVIALTATSEAGDALSAQPLDNTFTVDTIPPAVEAMVFSRSAAYLRSAPLTVTLDFLEPLNAAVTPTLSFTPSAYFTPVAPEAMRLSPTRFTFRTETGGRTPEGGVSYAATVDRTSVQDPAGNQAAADHVVEGRVDGNSPAALAAGSFTAPAYVALGQVFSASVQIANIGGTTAEITSTSLTFGIPGLTAVPSGANPTSLATGTSEPFGYSVTVGSAATTGPVTAHLSVAARDRAEGCDASLSNQELAPRLTVQAPAAFSASALTASAYVSQGQVFQVSLRVTNTGEASALSLSPELDFDGTGLTAVPSGTGPSTLAGGSNGTFTFTVTAAATASPGARSARLTLTGEDGTSNATVSLSDHVLSPQVTVQTPAALAVVSFFPPPGAVQGEAVGASVVMTNTGQATADITSTTLMFSGLGLTALPAASNPLRLPGNASATFHFVVTAGSAAETGVRTARVAVLANDSNSASDVSLVDRLLSPQVMVLARVPLTIGAFTSPAKVTRGQTFSASAVLTNTSPQAVVLTATSLAFSGTGLSAVPTAANPRVLDPDSGATFRYSVTAEAAAPSGPRTASLTVLARYSDAPTDVSLLDRVLSPQLTIETKPGLRVLEVSPSVATVRPGQTGIPVVVTVVNTASSQDGAAVTSLSATLLFDGGDHPGYLATPSAGNATTLAAGSSARLTFAVDLLDSVGPGPTQLSAALAGTDVNSGQPVEVETSTGLATWTVVVPPRLAVLDLRWGSVAAGGVLERGETTQLHATISNPGSQDVSLTRCQLLFSAGGQNPGLSFSAGTANPTLLASGRSETLTFDVSALLTATALDLARTVLLVVDAQSAGADAQTSASTQLLLANCPPTAVIAPVRPGPGAGPVVLDGTGSFDGPAAARSEGDPLSYTWTVLAQPAGSALTAGSFYQSGSAGWAKVGIGLERVGSYRFGLTVNDGHDESTLTTAVVAVGNARPVARVSRPTVSVARSGRVTLDGSGSTDPDGDALEYRWSLLSVPSGSRLTTVSIVPNNSPAAARPFFTPDTYGSFAGTLSVFDGINLSLHDSFTVHVLNDPPVAIAGSRASAVVGDVCLLDGSRSYDAYETELSYSWTVTSKPAGSRVTELSFKPNGGLDAARPAFTPDVEGDYQVTLRVNDGIDWSAPALTAVTILGKNRPPAGQRILDPIEGQVISQDADSVAPGLQTRVTFSPSSPSERVLVNGGGTSRPVEGSPNGLCSHLVTLPLGGPSLLKLFDPSSPLRTEPGLSVEVSSRVGPAARAEVDCASGGPRVLRLDGSRSTHVDRSASLTYHWSLSESPILTESFASSSPATTFGLQSLGKYRFSLLVTDPVGLTGTARVVATVDDVPPVAIVRAPAMVVLSRPDSRGAHPEATRSIVLDGRGSSDANGQQLSYLWEVVRAPDRSDAGTNSTTAVTLRDSTQVLARAEFSEVLQPGNTPRSLVAAGEYGFRIRVSDGTHPVTATAAVIALDPADPAPSADPGPDLRFAVLEGLPGYVAPATTYPDPLEPSLAKPFIRLDGGNSADPLGRRLAYTWELAEKPADSSVAGLLDAATAHPRFVPDRIGLYRISLQVRNPVRASEVRTVRVLLDNRSSPAPVAVAIARHPGSGRRTSATTPVLEALTGDRVILDPTGSTFSRADSEGPGTTLEWTQIEGERVELRELPGTGGKREFTAATPGQRRFLLTATGRSQGPRSDTARVSVVFRRGPPPKLTVETTATGTSSTGRELQNETPVAPTGSLKASLPTKVTMTARVSAPGLYRFVWTQVDGPRVLLTRVVDEGVRTGLSVTQFTPTTSRVYEFTVSATRDGDEPVTRRVRVVVSTPGLPIPDPVPVASPSTLPFSSVVEPPTDERGNSVWSNFYLDGSGSVTGQYPAGTRLAYQ